MTDPIRNTSPLRNRSQLLLGCGSAAIALALLLAPERALAQGINAGGTVTDGAAFIDDMVPGQTTVEVITPTTVIDWQPFEDVNGDALTFLPAGNSVLFGSSQLPNFAVLNRILPSTNGNIAVIDGSVISRITGPTGISTPGGFVAFYSPTGLLIGSTATFDVGSLLLTTLDTTPASFANFASGGNLSLTGASGSTARIQINSGAQISALAENSFFAVVAADVQMRGTALVNGSRAYVAGEVVNLRFSNGLFDIEVPVGTAAGGEVMNINGTVGGPSSTGAGDNHMIYGVAAAQNDPITMLFGGNLGFEPAQSAGIVNGEIILAANYNVFGRFVDGGTISDGINAVFNGNSATSDTTADILVSNFTSTSTLLAIGTHNTAARAVSGSMSVLGDLLLVGRESAILGTTFDANANISGDVLISARDYGVVSSGLQDLSLINAQGGAARINLNPGGSITIGGDVFLTADAFAGADDISGIAGSAQAGSSVIFSQGGTLNVSGRAILSARGEGAPVSNVLVGAESRGGVVQLSAAGGGVITIGQDVLLDAGAQGANGSLFSPSSVSNAFGGSAQISLFAGGGSITVNGSAQVFAEGRGGSSNNAGAGSIGSGGAALLAINDLGDINILGSVELIADGFGGLNSGGTGGIGRSVRASAATLGGGTIIVGDQFTAIASGTGGDGQIGGDGFGGIAGAFAEVGAIELRGLFNSVIAEGLGGNATFGFGGNGGIGRGGDAFFQANGTLTQTATLTIGGDAFAFAEGIGGDGGLAGPSGAPAGQGGDAFGGEAYIRAGGDNGNLTVTGQARAVATGFGGRGGFGDSTAIGGPGGNGFGGLAQVGLALLGLDGSIGQGSANFGFLLAEANGFGGDGGLQFGDFPTGVGGSGAGGSAILSARAGAVTADQVQLSATGFGGGGNDAGTGTGGTTALLGGQGGSLTANLINLFASGFGGFSLDGRGGDGQGGTAGIEGDGITVTINGSALIDASGSGGASEGGAGGDGNGGEAYVAVLGAATPGVITITGHTQVLATGQGGDTLAAFAAGNGTGGLAYLQAQAGSTVTLGSAQAVASGRGGIADVHEGGDGSGGTAELRSFGPGGRLIIQRNVPSDFASAPGDGAILNADGIGANTNGGDGIGGAGGGGQIGVVARAGGSIDLPTDPAADPGSVGIIRLLARGIGGGSSVDGGQGGQGFGGSGLIEADGTGSAIIMGETLFTVFGEGGSSAISTGNVNGGDGFGGNRTIRVLNGAEATLALSGGITGGQGGDGSGTGDGGDVFGGRNQVELDGGTLNIIGVLGLTDGSTGGTGNRGGDVFSNGESGVIIFSASNSDINFTPDASGVAGILLGGASTGGDGVIAGGNAQGAFTSFSLNNTNFSDGFLRIDTLAQGGNVSGLVGQGGSATGGPVGVNITGSTVNLTGETVIAANAIGGNGGSDAGSAGGAAISGEVTARLTNSSLIAAAGGQSGPGILRLLSVAQGGGGAATGNATSDLVRLELIGSTLTADELYLDASAFANSGPGASAQGGDAELLISGTGQLAADLIEISAVAVTGDQGFSQGGVASLAIAQGSSATVTTQDLALFADAFGAQFGRQANGAGQFIVNIAGGNVSAQNLRASAFGDFLSTSQSPSALIANGGNINVAGELTADLFGNLLIQTGQGSIIGSPVSAASTTGIRIFAQGNIEIAGDNNAVVGLGGDRISLDARDIDILAGARIGARAVQIGSLEEGFTAVLGGTTEGEGFTLTSAEMGRINATDFSLFIPEVNTTSDPNLPDLLIRDLSLTGTGGNGFANVRIFVGSDAPTGLVRVEGTLSYANAGADDLLEMVAGRIEVVTPGGIRIEGANGAPGGNLRLSANDIWAADAATITQLQADRNFAGRDVQLAGAASGSDDPLGYIRAGGVTLNVGQSLLVRNTGTAFAGGGILIGGGDLFIASSGGGQSGSGSQLDVFAYGRRQTAPGTFVVGEAFFNEVNFNRVSPGSALYLDASAFNDCIINTGLCPEPPPPPPPPVDAPPQINNPVVFEPPLTIGKTPVRVAGEDDDRFGIDFPEQPEAPLISEDPLLDDPVTSGGDASLYGGSATPPAGGN